MRAILLSLLLVPVACGPSEKRGDADAATGQPDAASQQPDASANQPDANGNTADAASGPDADTTDALVTDAGPTTVMLNEVLLDQTGTDSNEFVEISGTPNTDYSAYSVLQIDGDQGGLAVGEIVSVTALGTTDANGYYLANVAANTFQNGTQTLLLVRNYNAGGGTDIDTNDDGTIDNSPWAELVDAVAIHDGRPTSGNTDRTYAGNAVLMKVFGASDEPDAFGGASRIPDGTDTDQASDWTSNTPNFNNAGATTGEALNTPGAVNQLQP